MVAEAQRDLPSLSGLSLLVIDDDPSVVRGMPRVLTGLGAEVTGVASLREARVSLAESAPDAVLADLQASRDLDEKLTPYLIYCDPAMKEALIDVPRFATSIEPVSIQGETGTGKEFSGARPARTRIAVAETVRRDQLRCYSGIHA